MDGQEIKLNPGKTWVCILPNDRMDKAEFYGRTDGVEENPECGKRQKER